MCFHGMTASGASNDGKVATERIINFPSHTAVRLSVCYDISRMDLSTLLISWKFCIFQESFRNLIIK